jgi:hypothetical protein
MFSEYNDNQLRIKGIKWYNNDILRWGRIFLD